MPRPPGRMPTTTLERALPRLRRLATLSSVNSPFFRSARSSTLSPSPSSATSASSMDTTLPKTQKLAGPSIPPSIPSLMSIMRTIRLNSLTRLPSPSSSRPSLARLSLSGSQPLTRDFSQTLRSSSSLETRSPLLTSLWPPGSTPSI